MTRLIPLITSAVLHVAVIFSAPGAGAQQNSVLLKSDLDRADGLGWTAPGFMLPEVADDLPLVDPSVEGPGAEMLRQLVASGVAGGFGGVLYENRDGGHSALSESAFPGLARLRFGKGLRRDNLHWGLAGQIVVPATVIGNSSTALTGGLHARSLPRLAMTMPSGPALAFRTYENNHIYVYPEHRDHDAEDRYPANWPYMVVSQGSSGSDQPFLRALAMSVAALPAETREVLQRKGLIAPTMQMILRRSQTHVQSQRDYLTGLAHPPVFDRKSLAPDRMVTLASTLRPEEIPPMVRLSVENEDFSDKAGLAGYSEHLFDTPSAVARVWRSGDYRREMTISAQETRDPNDRELRFDWALLRGDPAKVRITPLDAAGTRARIEVDWHDPWTLPGPPPRETSRVDIGVFASNGVHASAPAIVSVSFPTHQKRVYAPVAGEMRLRQIDYSPGIQGAYYDPVLHWAADWRDRFDYDASGQIIGWLRETGDETLTLRGPGISVDLDYRVETFESGPKLRMLPKSQAAE